MSTMKPVASGVHRALYGAAIAAAAVSYPALGQDAAVDNVLDEVTVTGSRIQRDPNLVTSSPVTTLDAGEISHRGITRVEDLVNDLPQVVPELTSTESNGATGTATLDLRGLGSDRTLVLTNGHRMGFGDVFALAPDVNQIPGALIERVELLTGGASSVYGADAVAGVVNFIMKDDFEGVQVDWQYAGYQTKSDSDQVQTQIANSGFAQAPSNPRDGGTRDFNIIMGINADDGKGNLTGYLGYRDISAITHADRDFSACALSSRNGETCAGSATLPTGLITDFAGTYFTVAGDQFVPWDYTYYNYAPLNYFQRPDERFSAGMFGHYEISDGFEAYTEVQFMDDRSLAQIAPSGAFFVTNTINCSNAFLSAQQFSSIGCTDPSDVAPYYIGRRNVEGGPRFDDLRHTNLRMLVGLRGEINDAWSYDAFFNASRLRYSEVYNNDLSITRITRALDAVDDGSGGVTCQSVIDGSDPACVPWNVFQTGGVTQGALNYLVLPLFSKGDLGQNQAVAYITGDLTDYGWVIPSASDGVQVVAGLEYRDENFDYNPDQGFRSGDGAGQGGPTAAVAGAILVKEFFAEATVPIAQDQPGIESMSVDLRYRRSDYDIGFETDTWNVGGEWRPVDALMFRGGVSRAVRAPNVRELFVPNNQGLWAGTDPCAGPTPELSAAACANQGVTAAQYGSIPFSPAGQYNAIFGGNTALQPEESDSITFGAVWTPGGALDGLTVTVDYWSIEVEKAIAAGIGEEFTIRQCGATGDPSFCNLINRGPNGNLWIGSAVVQSTDVNIGFFEVVGVDIAATYAWEIGAYGSLDFALRGTVLDKFDEQPVPGAPINECAGFWGGDCARPRPEWKHTFNTVWSTPWNAEIAATWRHISEIKEFALDRYTAGARNYFDLSGTYYADWLGGETTLNVGISNVLDKDPPVNGLINNISVYSNGNTVPGTWDALGRYYFVGVTQAF